MGPRTELALEIVTEALHHLHDIGAISATFEGPADHEAMRMAINDRVQALLADHGDDPAWSELLVREISLSVGAAILLDRREARGGHLRAVD